MFIYSTFLWGVWDFRQTAVFSSVKSAFLVQWTQGRECPITEEPEIRPQGASPNQISLLRRHTRSVTVRAQLGRFPPQSPSRHKLVLARAYPGDPRLRATNCILTLSPLAHVSPTPANTPTNNAARAYAAQFQEPRPAQASGAGNPLRGMLLGRCRRADRFAAGTLEETREDARHALPGAARTAPIACHRLSRFTLQAQALSPGEAWQPGKRPSRLSGRRCRGARGPGSPMQPRTAETPTSRRGTGAAAHGHKDPEELAEAHGRALQGAGPVEDPGARAQARESQAHSRSGARGDVRARESSVCWSWGSGWSCGCSWGRSGKLGPEPGLGWWLELGRD